VPAADPHDFLGTSIILLILILLLILISILIPAFRLKRRLRLRKRARRFSQPLAGLRRILCRKALNTGNGSTKDSTKDGKQSATAPRLYSSPFSVRPKLSRMVSFCQIFREKPEARSSTSSTASSKTGSWKSWT